MERNKEREFINGLEKSVSVVRVLQENTLKVRSKVYVSLFEKAKEDLFFLGNNIFLTSTIAAYSIAEKHPHSAVNGLIPFCSIAIM